MNLKGKKGVDISAINGDVDIKKIKAAGYDFVMIRCGYGSDIKDQDDTQYENNVRKCEAIGMPWGAYLYSYALNIEEAKSEARHALRLLNGKKPTLPLAFDMEDADGYKARNGMPSNKTLVNICKTFLSTTSRAGYYSTLYASLSWLNNQLNDKSLLDNYDIWCAQWSTQCDFKGKKLGMWQYGGEINYLESNSIPGVGVIDKNKAFKDYPAVIKKGGWNGWPKEKILDSQGYKKRQKSDGIRAIKELLLIAKSKGIIKSGMDENGSFGNGTENAVNEILKIGAYKQNGIAGDNFIKYLTKLIREKI